MNKVGRITHLMCPVRVGRPSLYVREYGVPYAKKMGHTPTLTKAWSPDDTTTSWREWFTDHSEVSIGTFDSTTRNGLTPVTCMILYGPDTETIPALALHKWVVRHKVELVLCWRGRGLPGWAAYGNDLYEEQFTGIQHGESLVVGEYTERTGVRVLGSVQTKNQQWFHLRETPNTWWERAWAWFGRIDWFAPVPVQEPGPPVDP